MQGNIINSNNNNNKFYKSKYEFDINLFSNKKFKTIPLPTSSNIEISKPIFENSERVINIQREWLTNCGFYNTEEQVENIIKKQHLKLTALFYPFLNEIGLELTVLFYEHGFLIDDEFFEKGIFSTMMEKYFDRNAKDHDQIGKIYWEIYDRYEKYAHPINAERIIKGNERWTRGSVNANLNGTYNAEMTFEEYGMLRKEEIGADYAMTFILAFEDEYLPIDCYESQEFKQIIKNYAYFGFLSNDLYSFKNEMNDSSFANSVKLFAVQLGNIQDGVDKAYNLLIHYHCELFKSIDNLSNLYPNDKAVQIFVPRMKQTACGTYLAHLLCDRYNNN